MSTNNSDLKQKKNIQNNYEILEKNATNYDFSYKIIIVGNPGKINI